MGLNVNLHQMFGIPLETECIHCSTVVLTEFDDFDIECGDPNPQPGVWRCHVWCHNCEKDFYLQFKIPYIQIVKRRQ